MTIFRDLTLGIATLAGALACGAFVLGLSTVQGFVRDSLEHRTRAEAALLAEQLGALPDPAAAARVMQASFDAHGYRWAQLHDAQGQLVFRASRPAAQAPLPGWFERLVPVGATPVFQPVPSGPLAQGRLGLAPGELLARQALWQAARSLALLAALVMLAAVLLALAARMLLARTLSRIGDQVQDWSAQDNATLAERLPPELAGLGAAFEALRARAGARLAQQTRTIETLQEELALDPVTRLPNRKRFVAALQLALRAGAGARGHVLMFRQRDLAFINRRMPRRHTDQWLRGVAERVQAQLQRPGQENVLARLNGSDFGVLLPGMEPAQALRLAEVLRSELRGSRIELDDSGQLCRWALALTAYEPGEEPARVLARLDHGLMQSENAEPETIAAAKARPPRGESGEYAWKDVLLTALDQHRFSLALTRQLRQDGSLLCHRAMLSLHDPVTGQQLPAQSFIPPAIRLGLAADCDMQAMRLALDWLRGHDGELSALLSLASLGQAQFLPRLRELLQASPQEAGRLLLEIDAHGLIDHYADVRALCEIARATGVRVGLRRLTRQFGAMAHMHHLPLSYVRLDDDFVQGLQDSPGSQHLAASVAHTANSLGIAVYAMDPGIPFLRDWLAPLHVVLLQEVAVPADPAGAALG
ncbi:EAL domain-containing protein [Orrella sp. JC864]|uniref:bifunctional diguanylate cyclase/phosphodiesterase n=1 Tax=Orrella sp. JC864 TaxID=3120298 RepID=UPI0012BD5A36